MTTITPRSIAQALREAAQGKHPGALSDDRRTVHISVDLAQEIADALDPQPPGRPPIDPGNLITFHKGIWGAAV